MAILDNLVAWYRGYDATDSTGSYNGVFRNSATSSQVGDTQCGSYWSFPSTGDTVEFTPSTIPLNTSNGFTFSSWVHTPYSGSANTFLLQGNNHSPWAVAGTTGNVVFLQDCFGTKTRTTGWSMTSAMSAGIWYHIAVTATGSSSGHEATYYLNGTQVATASLLAGVCDPIFFNARYVGSGNPSSGNNPTFKRMTDIAFWNRALSPSEISTVAGGCLVNSTSSQTLVGQFASLVHDSPRESTLSNIFATTVHEGPRQAILSNTFATVAIELPPVSAVVPDITGTVGSGSTFDGSASIRPDFYNWSYVSVPAGSSISNAPIPFPNNGALKPLNMSDNVGLWHFEALTGITPDDSGGGRDLVVYGATHDAGKVGDFSLNFDGVSNYLEYSDADVFPGTTNSISLAFWQYGNSGANNSIVYATDAGGNRVVNVHLPFSGDVYFDCGNSGASYDRINTSVSAGDHTGKWNHWVFTKDVTAGVMSMYLNGSLYHSGVGKTRTLSTITDLYVGSTDGTSLFYSGLFDEFAVWSRVLDANEISQIYTAQSGGIAGIGSNTFSFTPDVSGSYEVNLKISNTVSSSAIATIAGAPEPPPFISGSSGGLLVASNYSLRYAEKASQQRKRRVEQIPFALSSKSFLSIRKNSDDEF